MRLTNITLWRRLRRLARALRHTPDRVLHGARRRRCTAAIAAARPGQVLFVCHGNICRSPYAAAALHRLLNGNDVLTRSAGFVGPGRSVPEKGQRIALLRGIELSWHRSQLVTAELVRDADLIVVMDETQRRAIAQRFERNSCVIVLGDLDPKPIDTRAVRDPYNQTEDVFEAVYDRIDRCVATLADALPADDATGATGGEAPTQQKPERQPAQRGGEL